MSGMTGGTRDAGLPTTDTGAVRFDRLMLACSFLMIAGLYIDGWAHYHLASARETFFTPWHAILYSGFAACAVALGARVAASHAQGRTWAASVPDGYAASVVGVVVMAVGGIADMLWHLFFGIETDIAAQLSPAHLVLAVGMGMIVSGPLCAAARRGTPPRNLTDGWPATLSMALLLAVFALFSKSFHPFYIPWAAGNVRVGIPDAALTAEIAYLQEALGVASIAVQSAILMGLLLFALRARQLVPGSITVVVGIATGFFDVSLLPAAVAAGIASDVTLWRLRPSAARLPAVRAFAFLVPAYVYSLYFAAVAMTRGGIWWPVHLWAGSIVIAGLMGALVSVLVYPPGDQASALASTVKLRS